MLGCHYAFFILSQTSYKNMILKLVFYPGKAAGLAAPYFSTVDSGFDNMSAVNGFSMQVCRGYF